MAKNYQDAIPPEGGRAYKLTQLPNGNYTIEDVTEYTQEGTPWGASDVLSTAVLEYTCAGNILSGQGSIGRFKADSNAKYSLFSVNGKSYDVRQNGETSIELVSDAWYTFILDDTNDTINFKTGGGLSNSKLALATATVSDVASGKTFYSGDKELKTGTAELRNKLYIFKDGAYKNGFNLSWSGTVAITNNVLQLTFASGSMNNVYSTTNLYKSGYTLLGIKISSLNVDGTARSRTFYCDKTSGGTSYNSLSVNNNGVIYFNISSMSAVYLLIRAQYSSLKISEIWLEK